MITDANGQALVRVLGENTLTDGTDNITASALGDDETLILTIGSANFSFLTPDPSAEVFLNQDPSEPVTVHWDEDGVPQEDETINFFCYPGSLSSPSAVTNENGDVTVTIRSTNAGFAVITAVAIRPSGPSSQLTIEFVAFEPETLLLQADPTTLDINAENSLDQQSIIIAVVHDPANILVVDASGECLGWRKVLSIDPSQGGDEAD
ncbi:hypothetical protein NKDENANG_04153 [Candidatus Entotheonellaceae bacterium PAL068K]